MRRRKKITIREFFECKKTLCIHCNTEEKANLLCKTFDRLGKNWSNNSGSYSECSMWSYCKEDTCYSNKGGFSNLEFYRRSNIPIYEFEEVDLGVTRK